MSWRGNQAAKREAFLTEKRYTRIEPVLGGVFDFDVSGAVCAGLAGASVGAGVRGGGGGGGGTM